MLYHCTRWLFYSGFLSLVHLWVALAISLWVGAGKPTKVLLDGSLFVFAIVLVATSYGTHYDRVTGKWWKLGVQAVGVIVGGGSLVFYTAMVLSDSLQLQTPSSVKYLPVPAAIFALIYGLGCNMLNPPASIVREG